MKWVVKHALDERVAHKIVGIKYGYRGLLPIDVMPLNEQNVRAWDRDGGTNLGTSRTNPFNDEGQDRSEELVKNIVELDIPQ